MLYSNVYVDGDLSSIEVIDNVITDICPANCPKHIPEDNMIDFHGRCWAIPGMVNMHTHSAMTLFRGAGSGLPLSQWLNECILPLESQLSPDDVYRGALSACNEMLATGTTAFNDMYFSVESTVRAAQESGMSATIALSMTDRDFTDDSHVQKTTDFFNHFEQMMIGAPERIKYAIAPHAIYTVSEKHLLYLADFAAEHRVPLHMHLSETRKERTDCISSHSYPPVVYLDKIGFLEKTGNRFIAAHSLWLDDNEIEILGSYGATVVHNPNSNLKLGSGHAFKYEELKRAGVNVTLGTDGCASSDNLDLVEAMKIMSLLQKGIRNDPSVLPANEVFAVATQNGREALGLTDSGLAVGKRADFCFIDLNKTAFDNMFSQNDNAEKLKTAFLNRLVYAAHGDVVCGCVMGDRFTKVNLCKADENQE